MWVGEWVSRFTFQLGGGAHWLDRHTRPYIVLAKMTVFGLLGEHRNRFLDALHVKYIFFVRDPST